MSFFLFFCCRFSTIIRFFLPSCFSDLFSPEAAADNPPSPSASYCFARPVFYKPPPPFPALPPSNRPIPSCSNIGIDTPFFVSLRIDRYFSNNFFFLILAAIPPPIYISFNPLVLVCWFCRSLFAWKVDFSAKRNPLFPYFPPTSTCPGVVLPTFLTPPEPISCYGLFLFSSCGLWFTPWTSCRSRWRPFVIWGYLLFLWFHKVLTQKTLGKQNHRAMPKGSHSPSITTSCDASFLC